MVVYDQTKFNLVESADMQEAGGVVLNNGRHRAPLYVRLKDKSNDQELVVIHNHLARGDAEFRTQQAGALREWARTKSTPIVAIGDFNFFPGFPLHAASTAIVFKSTPRRFSQGPKSWRYDSFKDISTHLQDLAWVLNTTVRRHNRTLQ